MKILEFLLLPASFTLIVLSVILLFVNGLWSLITFLLSLVFFFVWGNTPEAKEAIARNEADISKKKATKEAKLASIQQLESNLIQLSQNSQDNKVLEQILDVLNSLNRKKTRSLIISRLAAYASVRPHCFHMKSTLLDLARKWVFGLCLLLWCAMAYCAGAFLFFLFFWLIVEIIGVSTMVLVLVSLGYCVICVPLLAYYFGLAFRLLSDKILLPVRGEQKP